MSQIQHYGVNEFTKTDTDTALHAENIIIRGYTVIPNVLSAEEVEIAKTKMNEVYAKQLKELDNGVIEKINDTDIARALLVYDDFFLHKVALNKKVTDVINVVLGKYFIIREQNGIINRANSPNYQLKWHRDLLFQHFTSSRPFAISALFCLQDFNEINGGTYLLPASQKIEAFPSEEYILQNEICANAPIGSAIVFDSMLYHRAGHNKSQNDRIGINNMYVQPYIKQAISFPSMLKGKYSDDPYLNLFLGYDSETDSDVKSWRMKRFNRKK
ncbi:MAG: phytanoyl-CoA dioxygenase family protein [Bacteroidetes bacterium]|nr:phytanoyl-CoA dioxygenase family protein [Bacteroidota bacterium]